jgi:hypothetical protein
MDFVGADRGNRLNPWPAAQKELRFNGNQFFMLENGKIVLPKLHLQGQLFSLPMTERKAVKEFGLIVNHRR